MRTSSATTITAALAPAGIAAALAPAAAATEVRDDIKGNVWIDGEGWFQPRAPGDVATLVSHVEVDHGRNRRAPTHEKDRESSLHAGLPINGSVLV